MSWTHQIGFVTVASERLVDDDSDRAIHQGIEPTRADRRLPEGGQHRRQGEFQASFAGDAVVVDVSRELRGLDAITAWASADIFGAHVRFDVLDVTERNERTILRSRSTERSIERDYPIRSVMNHEFAVVEGKIAELRIGF